MATKTKTTKRKPTAKQLEALAKGRAKRASKLNGTKTTTKTAKKNSLQGTTISVQLHLDNLTKNDVDILLNNGVNPIELRQIDRVIKYLKITKEKISGNEKSKKISWATAKKELGKDALFALDRAAFHWSSSREKDGYSYYFDASSYFE